MVDFEDALRFIAFKNPPMYQDFQLCKAVLSVYNKNSECKALEYLKTMIMDEAQRIYDSFK